jgi:hemoglobin-like flavoprotein
MTPEQAQAVVSTWKKVSPIEDTVAGFFYGRLFELDPGLRPLFSADLAGQKKKLMLALNFIVSSLDRPDTLFPAVRQLGMRHVAYGVKDEHFVTVRTALLRALEQGLGPDWNNEAEDAWSAVYETVATKMKTGMAEASAKA